MRTGPQRRRGRSLAGLALVMPTLEHVLAASGNVGALPEALHVPWMALAVGLAAAQPGPAAAAAWHTRLVHTMLALGPALWYAQPG